MKKILFFALSALFLYSTPASAAEIGVKYDSRTGDKEFDLSLGELNIEAKTDISSFVTHLSTSYKVDRKKIELLIKKDGMEPADAYMSVRLVRITGKPLEVVAVEFRNNRGKGWGVIAKRLGIKPGSSEFHALKNDDSGILWRPDKKGRGAKEGMKEKRKGKGNDK